MAIRFGLIGAGRMGKVFASTLAFNVSEVDLIAVADPNHSALDEVESLYKVEKCYKDYHQLLDNTDID
ncbi:MAG: Gfo/Idh/MocA family oxidoreductase, partial [Chloroflexota bacterium]